MGAYEFLEGGLKEFHRLPSIRAGTLPDDFYGRVRTKPLTPSFSPGGETRQNGTIPEHSRNDMLFKVALREARSSGSADCLIQRLLIHNQRCDPPLPDAEVATIAQSAWRYEQTGKNRVGQPARAVITESELKALEGNGEALLLLTKLRIVHGWRNGDEFVLANAMAASFGWERRRFRAACNFLVEKGFLVLTHIGGRGLGDPPRFSLGFA